MRDANIARAQNLAAQSSSGGDGHGSARGRPDKDGVYHVEMSAGVGGNADKWRADDQAFYNDRLSALASTPLRTR